MGNLINEYVRRRRASLTNYALVLLASSFHCALSANICLEQVSSVNAVWLEEHPAGGKMVVASQNGVLQILPIPAVGSNTTSDKGTVFLDLSSRTLFQPNTESGFLSFAFHPDFLTNGRFFVSYICNATDCTAKCGCAEANGCVQANCTARTVVAEYNAGPNPSGAQSVSPVEVQKIITFGRPTIQRNGGQIWFGPDKYLYYASGDGGVNSTAQNGSLPFGKVLRVDVKAGVGVGRWGTYGIPADNPFTVSAAYAEEVYALGFRNPWRCSYDAVTAITICGDVGEKSFEEVNVLQSGKNYGWPLYEGSQKLVATAPDGLEKPVLEYPHDSFFNSVLGGYVYRGNTSPCLTGYYVYGDSNGEPFVGTFPPLSAGAETEEGNISVARGGKIDNSDFPVSSWATDKAGDLYRLSPRGVYRVVNASQCGLSCGFSKLQVPANVSGNAPPSGKPSRQSILMPSWTSQWLLALVLLSLMFAYE